MNTAYITVELIRDLIAMQFPEWAELLADSEASK